MTMLVIRKNFLRKCLDDSSSPTFSPRQLFPCLIRIYLDVSLMTTSHLFSTRFSVLLWMRGEIRTPLNVFDDNVLGIFSISRFSFSASNCTIREIISLPLGQLGGPQEEEKRQSAVRNDFSGAKPFPFFSVLLRACLERMENCWAKSQAERE